MNSDLERATGILCQALNQKTNLSPKQAAVLKCLLEGENVLYVDRTGAGKSAVYFLVTKLFRERNPKCGPAIIISPLISLMNDQQINASKFGLKAALINKTVSTAERTRIFRAMEKNAIDLLYVTPEMLSSTTLYENVPQLQISYEEEEEDAWTKVALIVIDEVHCVSDWGHDFRSSYFLGLRKALSAPWAENTVKLGTSATVTQRVAADIHRLFDCKEIRGNLMRENFHLRIIPTMNEQSRVGWVTKWLIQKGKGKNVLVFVSSRANVDRYTAHLKTNKIEAVGYHGQMDDQERADIENKFRDGEVSVVVSTLALGMGFDKKDIHAVIHTYTPSSPVQYYQEIGRAGRDSNIQAYIYLLPTQPWRDDTKREQALERIISVLMAEKRVHKDAVIKSVAAANVTEWQAKDAIILGTSKGFFREEPNGLLVFIREPSIAEKTITKEYREQRAAEVRYMSTLGDIRPESDKCLWRHLLMFLGQVENEGFRCLQCTFCLPKDGDLRAVNPQVYYRRKTPRFNISVYGFAQGSEVPSISDEVIKKALLENEQSIVAFPPNWRIAYIPTRNDANEKDCQEIAKWLGMDYFCFVRRKSTAGSMTLQSTQETRQQVIDDKFDFLLENIPPCTEGGVLLYDDAMKSGYTIEKVAEPLLKRGITVVGLVKTFWTQRDMAPAENFTI